MEKHLQIRSIKDEDNDFEYWQNCSAQERIDAIEFLRSQHFKFSSKTDAELPKFQRVCTITQRKEDPPKSSNKKLP